MMLHVSVCLHLCTLYHLVHRDESMYMIDCNFQVEAVIQLYESGFALRYLEASLKTVMSAGSTLQED